MCSALWGGADMIAAGIGLNLLLGVAAYKKKAVTKGGAVSGVILGSLIFCSVGLLFWTLLGGFFISSTVMSRIGRRLKVKNEAINERGSVRDLVQVAANGGAALIAALLYQAGLMLDMAKINGMNGELFFLTLFAAAFASANADTWASELGVLSPVPPRSVLTWKQVEPGTSGGVSLAGSAAAFSGALLIAAQFYVLLRLYGFNAEAALPPAAAALAAGFVGSFIDSLLGASFQGKYLCSATGAYTERRWSEKMPNKLVNGCRFITNDAVNALSSLLAAAAAGSLILFFWPG